MGEPQLQCHMVEGTNSEYEQGEGIDPKKRAIVQFMVKREGLHAQA